MLVKLICVAKTWMKFYYYNFWVIKVYWNKKVNELGNTLKLSNYNKAIHPLTWKDSLSAEVEMMGKLSCKLGEFSKVHCILFSIFSCIFSCVLFNPCPVLLSWCIFISFGKFFKSSNKFLFVDFSIMITINLAKCFFSHFFSNTTLSNGDSRSSSDQCNSSKFHLYV